MYMYVCLLQLIYFYSKLYLNENCFHCFSLSALAEILSVKEVSGRKHYYVHYIDCE